TERVPAPTGSGPGDTARDPRGDPGGDPGGRGSRRRAGGGSATTRPAQPGPDGVRRQLPVGPGAPDERGAPRGRVRPGGLPQGDGLVWAMVVAAGAAGPRRGRGGGRGGAAGGSRGRRRWRRWP